MERQELAVALSIHVRTLDRWHLERRGPPRITIGRRILYREAAVNEWLQANEEAGTVHRR
ncbi:helix-turn-helix domain-containing protein [Methylobacterium sp. C25]|uniref:helix-turn-helix domain-containing protein n=1 Tax=Methylobacterium sp. C25 TaxID=2721622 RepID=UPI003FA373ED